jgi:hypothetical protein
VVITRGPPGYAMVWLALGEAENENLVRRRRAGA